MGDAARHTERDKLRDNKVGECGRQSSRQGSKLLGGRQNWRQAMGEIWGQGSKVPEPCEHMPKEGRKRHRLPAPRD